MRVLVTGATGFVGSHLLDVLAARGDEVRVFALPDTVGQLAQREGIAVVAGNLDDPATLASAAAGIQVVYHIAGLVPPQAAADLFRINAVGTQNLLKVCVAGGVQRFVLLSSVAVYQPAPWPFMWPINEDYPRGGLGSGDIGQYALSKIAAEDAVMRAGEQTPLRYTILRAPVVYGPGARLLKPVLRQLQNRPWQTNLPAAQFRHMQWVHVRDLANALQLAGEQQGSANAVFNVAGGELFSWADLNMTAGALLANPALRIPAMFPSGDGFGPGLRYDISRARQFIGYAPRISLRQGFAEILASPAQ